MRTHMIAVIGGPLLVALATVPAAGQAPAQPGTAQTSSTTAGERANRTNALGALQDARVTIATLTEASMSHDAREAFADVSSRFRTLYKAYVGEEPTPEKTAVQAAAAQADPSWRTAYDALSTSVGRLAAPAQPSAVGTSGTAGSAGVAQDLTAGVHEGFSVLLQQLQRFRSQAEGPARGTAR